MPLILAVDDSPSMRKMVSFSLTGAGYQVVEAVDLHGHRMTIGTTVPILMLTTESSDLMKQAGRAAGATGWLVKPFDPARLLEVIKKVIK